MPDCRFTLSGASTAVLKKDEQITIQVRPPLLYPCTQTVAINGAAVAPGGEGGGFRIVQSGADGTFTLRALHGRARALLSVVRTCPATETEEGCEHTETAALGIEFPGDPAWMQIVQTLGLPITAPIWLFFCFFIMLWGVAGIPFTGSRHLREACKLCKQLTEWIPDWIKRLFR